MSEPLVLVDSSAWIGYLLGHPAGPAHTVGRLLQTNRVATNAVVRVEILTGARDELQYAVLEETFDGLHELELTPAIWRHAARLRFDLRRTGHLVPLPDVVIACCAVAYGCQVFHLDRHFDRMAGALPLRIYSTTDP